MELIIKCAYKNIPRKKFFRFSHTTKYTYRDVWAIIGLHWILKKYDYLTNGYRVKRSFLLNVLTKKIIKRFDVWPVDGDSSESAAGEEFITFLPTGIFKNGKVPLFFYTKIGAILAYRRAFKNYLKDYQDGCFFQWRVRPELTLSLFKYTIYSRFIVTYKRPKELKLRG